MTSTEILDNIIKGTALYRKYLELNNKGKSKTGVSDISVKDNNKVLLYLNGNISSTDELDYIIGGYRISGSHVRLLSYDKRRRILTIIPDETVIKIFKSAPADTVFVETDMLFLITRVLNWYKNMKIEGWTPVLPTKYPVIKSLTPDDNTDLPQTSQQTEAISTIAKSPLSYIWGPPGTGKTQCVLARSLISYIKADKTVIVSAPTNYALDQVLFGVMNVIRSEGLDTRKVQRLGVPSPEFAEVYPYSCEEASVAKETESLQSELHDIATVLALKKRYEQGKDVSYIVSEYVDRLKEFIRLIDISKENLNDLNYRMVEIEEKRNAIAEKIKERKNYIQECKQNEGVFARIFRKSQSTQISDAINTAFQEITELNAEMERLADSYDSAKEEYVIENRKIRDLNINVRIIKKKISSEFAFSKKFEKVNVIMSMNDMQEVIKVIDEYSVSLTDGLEEITAQLSSFPKYKDLSDDELKSLQSSYEERINDITRKTDDALFEANVIALTADTFFIRYEQLLNLNNSINHVFIDEAGYLSLAKGLAFLSLDAPISLLGDHMQLPPICELDDKEIAKNPELLPIVFWNLPIIFCIDAFFETMNGIANKYFGNAVPDYNSLNTRSLDTTFRFGSNIADVLARHVYSSDFHSAAGNDCTKITVLDAPYVPGKLNRQNIAEAEIIKRYAATHELEDYYVITPYKNQVILLREELYPYIDKTNVNTVHSSQGQEWDTVIFSVSDTNNKFFSDSNNIHSRGKAIINTAISRTKKHLIIACDAEYWQSQYDQLIGDIVRCCDERITMEDLI